MSALKQKLNEIKKLNSENATVSLWIIEKHNRNREFIYNIKWIDIEENLANKLEEIVSSAIQESNEVQSYDYLTIDQDEKLLVIDTNATDFPIIFETISQGTDVDKVESFAELSRAWAYIIKIQIGNKSIMAFKRIIRKNELKKASWFVNVVFRDKKFIDIEEEEIFKIEKSIDFFSFDDDLFILNKKEFEIGLNFREGMITKGQKLLTEFEKLKIVDNIQIICDYVGNNMTLLRKLATINNNGYFRNKDFLNKLKKINSQEKWGLVFKNGTLKVDKDQIELILTVLNKDRLKDLIEGDTYDVTIKKPVNNN
jgi:transcriptional regulator of heat shock response